MVESHLDMFKSDSLNVAKVAFPIVIKSYKLIGNCYKTKLPVLCLWVFSIVRLLNLACLCGK